MFIDTHCHLDAPEFAADVLAVSHRARAVGVGLCVLPAVQVVDFESIAQLALQMGNVYALGTHPLYSPAADSDAAAQLAAALVQHRVNPLQTAALVAVGEIGLDFFVPALCEPPQRARQIALYREQLEVAQQFNLPIILHVRKSADELLKHLRLCNRKGIKGGIAHAFNGSLQQAHQFIDLGFKLGFGGTLTYERATHIRELAVKLPLHALVLETDAPDIPPQWLYVNAAQRSQGVVQTCNEPAQLPRIAQVLAQLRGISVDELARQTTTNARQVLNLPLA